MKTEITGSTYEDGKRVEIQRVIYEKSDDIYILANLTRRYERLCNQIEKAKDDTVLENLKAEKEKLTLEISEQESVIAGYDI